MVAAAGCDDAAWHRELDRPATRRGVASFDSMLARRTAGEPLQYVLGSWGFRTLDLFVDRRVLIPRPETEIVAGCALAELQRRAGGLQSGGRAGGALRSSTQAKVVAGRPPAPPHPGSGDGAPTLLAADLGCGSGAIGLSLAAERVDVEVVCTDVSADALAVAERQPGRPGPPRAHVCAWRRDPGTRRCQPEAAGTLRRARLQPALRRHRE